MRSIEKLALWLIPAELLTIILPSILTFYTSWVPSDPASRVMVSTLAVLSSLAYLIGHVVIGVWLLYQPHKAVASSRVWLIFGLVAGFWALGIFLLMQIPAVRIALEPDGTV